MNADTIIASSPLEFQEDYFANNQSTDDFNFDSTNAEIRLNENPLLHKTTSIVSLKDPLNNNENRGIMFNKLRTTPVSNISLTNVNLTNDLKNFESQNDDILSIYQHDDTISTMIQSPSLLPVGPEENDNTQGDIEDTILKTGFPFQFGNELEKSDNLDDISKFFNNKQHFFILSAAGKPIYSMHGSYNIFIVYSAIIQTIVSFYEYSSNGKESIKIIESNDIENNKPIKFVFLNKSPIILLSIVQSNQSTLIEIQQQLDFIYSFILSALSKPYIDKIFNKYANFDLRNLLGKTDILTLDSICEDLSNNLNISQVIGGLQCLRMHLSIRARLEKKLLNFKSDNLLYGLIIGPNEKLISIMRPKRHTLHTSDLMLVFEMIFNTNTFKSKNDDNSNEMKLITNETFWVPICLPKFNASGHLYNLIQFFQLNDERLLKLHDIEYDNNQIIDNDDDTKIGIILMSPYKDSFNELRKISNEIAKTILFDSKIFKDIWNSLVGNGRIIVDQVIENKNDNHKNNFSSLINKLNLNTNMNDNIEFNKSLNWNGILHFSVRSKRSAQCIFPESKYFNIKDKKIKRNLLNIYKYLRHRLNIIWNDSIYLDVNENNEPVLINNNNNNSSSSKGNSTNINGASNLDSNTVIYEDWIDCFNKNERVIGFACKFGTYEVFIIGKGNISENEMLTYGLKIVKWVRKQDSRIFISTGCIF